MAFHRGKGRKKNGGGGGFELSELQFTEIQKYKMRFSCSMIILVYVNGAKDVNLKDQLHILEEITSSLH
jgi:hypothetical protein